MTRFALTSLLLLPLLAIAADPLPDGAEFRLGSPPRYDVDSSAAISPDGKKIATIPPNAAIHVWETDSGKLLSGTRYGNRPSLFGWSKEGKLRGLFQGTECFLLHEWADDKANGPDEKTQAELRKDPDPLAKRPYLRGKALSADGARVAFLYELSNRGDSELRLYTPKPNTLCRLADPDFTHQFQGGEWVGFSGDGNTLFVAQRRKVTAYDLTANKPSEPAWVLDLPKEQQKFIEKDGQKIAVQGNGWPQSVLSADGKRVVIEFSHNGATEVWDGPAAKKLHSWEEPWYGIPGNAETREVAVSPDGKRVAISTRQKTGLVGGVIYDLDTGKEAVKLAAGPNATHWSLKFSPDGKRLYRRYQVWDAETGKDISLGTGHRGQVTSLVVSGDGKVIVTAGEDLTARGWDAKTGKELWRADFPVPVSLRRVGPDTAVAVEHTWNTSLEKSVVTLSTGAVSAMAGDMGVARKAENTSGEKFVRDELLAITPDGKTAVTVDRQSPALRVWDWPKGALRATLKFDPPVKGRFGSIYGATFTADGKELVGVFLYPDAKPMQGSGPSFRGVACLERWDIAGEKRIDRTLYKWSEVPSLTTNGKRLLVMNRGTVTDALDGEVLLSPNEEEKRSGRVPNLHGGVLSPDGNTLTATDGWTGEGKVHHYDLSTGKRVGTLTVGDHSGMLLAYLPDGRLMSAGESVMLWKAVK